MIQRLQSAPDRQKTVLILTAGLSVVIFFLALIPLPAPPPAPGTDKLHHLIAFAALILPCAVLHPRALIWVLPAAVFEAGLIEIVQPYVNRMREWADFVADLKGIALGLGLGLALRGTGIALSQSRATASRGQQAEDL